MALIGHQYNVVVARPAHRVPMGSAPLQGRMSVFGGPEDTGVGPDEGLALIEPEDLDIPCYRELFLPTQPAGTTGLARRLNPMTFYVALRWDYALHPRTLIRGQLVLAEANGRGCWLRPVDWGPNIRTGRVADVSQGAAEWLRLVTDGVVKLTLPW